MTKVSRCAVRPHGLLRSRDVLLSVVLLLGTALVLQPGMKAQRVGDFEVLGPGGGGGTFHAAISPLDPQTAMVACDMTGTYLTHDGGRSWRMINLRAMSAGFGFDPKDPKILYALGMALWQSTDGGVSWKVLWPKPSSIGGWNNNEDHAEVELTSSSGMTLPAATAFAVDPRDGRQLWVVVKEHGSALYHSDDRGESWKRVTMLPGEARGVTVAASGIWMSGPQGFWRWEDGKLFAPSVSATEDYWHESWADADGPGAAAPVTLLGVHDGALYLTKAARGASSEWKKAVLPGDGGTVITAAAGHDGRTFYASFNELHLDGRTWMGLAKSSDAGATWSVLWKDDGGGNATLHDAWITPALGSTWGDAALNLAVSTTDHSLLYATDYGRTMRSVDGGEHWEALYSHATQSAGQLSWVSSGLDVETSWGTFWDPFDPQRMFVGFTDIGLFRSEDGGRSWISSTQGMPQAWKNTTYWVVFDPEVRGRMWAATSFVHDLPRPKMWRHQSVGGYRGGVCVSEDGGRTWKVSGEGLPQGAVTHLLMDPRSKAGQRVFYAAVTGRGVYKSSDDGRTWQLHNAGIGFEKPMAYRLALASNGDLYVVLVRRSEKDVDDAENFGAVYRSKDGAATWQKVSLPRGVSGPNGITVDPHDPARLYLAAWPHPFGPHGSDGGIYLSTDKGAHWSRIFSANEHIFDVTYDPRNPRELYATGFESSAWISKDAGEHWRRIEGYNFMWGQRVFADPVRPGWVYINTFGGGVWHGRTGAKPGLEDIATPQAMPADRSR